MANSDSIYAKLNAQTAPYEAQRAVAKQQYETGQRTLTEQLAARLQQLQNRYDSQRQQMVDSYNRQRQQYQNQYDTRRGALHNEFNANNERYGNENRVITEQMAQNNARALQNAYIQARQAQRALPQYLAAQGMHGGMTETSMVRLNNNYQNNRNSIEQGYQKELAAVEREYQNALADLQRQYNSNVAELDTALQGNLAGLETSHQGNLANLDLGYGDDMSDLELAYAEKLAALGNEYYARDQDLLARITAAKAQAEYELAALRAAELKKATRSTGGGPGNGPSAEQDTSDKAASKAGIDNPKLLNKALPGLYGNGRR